MNRMVGHFENGRIVIAANDSPSVDVDVADGKAALRIDVDGNIYTATTGNVEQHMETIDGAQEKADAAEEASEPVLGNPTGNGFTLVSTIMGVRTWVARVTSVAWGSITGTLSDQTDLQDALDLKANLDLTNQPFKSAVNSITAFQIHRSDGTSVFSVDTVNRRMAGDGQLHIQGIADETQQIIQANTTQTGNLTEWQNSSGVALCGVDKRGIPFSYGTAGSTNYYAGGSATGNMASIGIQNTGLGQFALASDTTGGYNLAVGYEALRDNEHGSYNVALGTRALMHNVVGSNNVAIGRYALEANVSGSFNMAFGKGSFADTIASYNTGIGYRSGHKTTTGIENVAIGYRTLHENLVGAGNVCIGSQSGFSVLGGYNTFIGYNSGRYETGSNKLYIANSNTATPLIYGEFDSTLLKINGTLQTAQDRIKSTETSTTMATVSDSIEVHFCNSTTAYTLTLPTHITGKEIKIINTNTGVVSLTGTINGSTSKTLIQYQVATLVSNGTNWFGTIN